MLFRSVTDSSKISDIKTSHIYISCDYYPDYEATDFDRKRYAREIKFWYNKRPPIPGLPPDSPSETGRQISEALIDVRLADIALDKCPNTWREAIAAAFGDRGWEQVTAVLAANKLKADPHSFLVRECNDLGTCIERSGCENPARFGGTEANRIACLKSCTKVVDECKAGQKLELAQIDKLKAAGGKPEPICPRNYSISAGGRQDKFGNYTCFAAEGTPVPQRFKCPNEMELYIPPGSKGMVTCRWKISNRP